MRPPTTPEAVRISQLEEGFSDCDQLLDLILRAFEYMTPLIDPPSSALDLTPETLRIKAQDEAVFVAATDDRLLGCVFCKPEADCLYIGKLAVDPACRGRGVGRRLLAAAQDHALRLGRGALRLQTRIELLDNHAVFAAWGFVVTGYSAHAGFNRPTSVEMRKPLFPAPRRPL